MLLDGTRFLMNIPLLETDKFIKKERYTYKFEKPKARFIIEIEHFENKILVVSFYRHGYGRDNAKYKLRFKTPAVIALRVFQACLSIYEKINRKGDYALFFHASDDLGQYKEYNDRMSAYDRFFEYYKKDYHEYKQIGSLALNIKGIYHSELYMTPDLVEEFYGSFATDIQILLNEEG